MHLHKKIHIYSEKKKKQKLKLYLKVSYYKVPIFKLYIYPKTIYIYIFPQVNLRTASREHIHLFLEKFEVIALFFMMHPIPSDQLEARFVGNFRGTAHL